MMRCLLGLSWPTARHPGPVDHYDAQPVGLQLAMQRQVMLIMRISWRFMGSPLMLNVDRAG